VPGRIEIDAKSGVVGTRPARAERKDCGFCDVEVLDLHIDVRLLRNSLARPLRRVVVINALECEQRSMHGQHYLRPIFIELNDLTPEQLGVKPREHPRVRTVKDYGLKGSDHESTLFRASVKLGASADG
jgi:hypothetical protein